MLGVDLYDRYQDVTDWRRVRDAGVRFCIVKGTDGGGPAVVRADAFVRGARSVGIPVGLYHYAQLTPAPETQADVLHAEVTRLGATGLPPALDLEGPFHTAPLATAVEFGRRFLTRLRTHYARVTLYANTSFLGQLQPDSWGVPGLLIWAANYSVNDGTRHPYAYRGRVDIHQYTDRGRLPGITASGVDLNWAQGPIFEEDDMSAEAEKRITEIQAALGTAETATVDAEHPNGVQVGTQIAAIYRALPGLLADVAELKARAPADIDESALADALAERGLGGVRTADVIEAVRQAFARAGQPGV